MNDEIILRLTRDEAAQVHLALYLRLLELAAIEDWNPSAMKRAAAQRDAAPLISVANKLHAAGVEKSSIAAAARR